MGTGIILQRPPKCEIGWAEFYQLRLKAQGRLPWETTGWFQAAEV